MTPTLLIASLGLLIGLLLLRAASCGIMPRFPFPKRALIVGAGPLSHKLIEEIEAHPRCRYTIVGIVDDTMASGEPSFRYPLLGPIERLGKIIEEVHPHRIIVAVTEQRGRLPVYRLLESRVDGIVVENGVEVYERLTGKLAIEALTPSNLIFCQDFRQSRLVSAAGRAISLLASLVGLAVFAPLFGVIALAIKLDSPGPVFFIQYRVGMGGKRFKLIKFRTMRRANYKTSEWAKDNGHRITHLGRWLRKFRLDELPQFLNILRGDMNLVGPRPHPASNFELFVLVSRNAPECGLPIPYYSLRSMVRPGVTGWAQVRYRYANDLEEEIEKMRYDLYYIKHQSIWLDFRILFETVKIILKGRGLGDADACQEQTDGETLVTGPDTSVPSQETPVRISSRTRRNRNEPEHSRV